MKNILSLIFVLPLYVFAQQDVLNNALSIKDQQSSTIHFNPVFIEQTDALLEDRIALYFKKSEPYLQSNQTQLKLSYSTKSRMGFHLQYVQMLNGIAIYGAILKVNIDQNGNTLSVINQLVNTQNWTTPAFTPNTQIGEPIWIVSNNNPVPAYRKSENGFHIITNDKGELIRQKDAHLYLASDDTIVTGKVFGPDPLTPIGVIAGQNGTYKNFNDSDYALLNDQRIDVTFPVSFENDSFVLKNEYAQIVDLIFPNIAPATSATPTFDYLRGADAFKDIMCLYHITNLQHHLKGLGIANVNIPIRVDAHGGTADNSSFLPTDTTLKFGTGGVPDAEDADVITHEFTHALSFFITPSNTMSNERRAIEEAICDVQAALYSYRYNTFNWRKLYNWDAPNPVASGTTAFWNGRNGASTKTYANYINSPYSDCEIWSSTILDISEAIGGDSTLVLLFNSLASYSDNTTMPQAAQLFMQADSVLTNKAYGWKIGPIFNARGLGNFPTGVNDQQKVLNTLSFANSAAFAVGEGDAQLTIPFACTVKVMDMQGRVLMEKQLQPGMLAVNPADFHSGLYFVSIQTPTSQTVLKLVRN